MYLASLVGTAVPERLAQVFSTETTDWSAMSLMPSGRMDCWSSSVDATDAKKADGGASIIIIIILLLLLLYC